MRLIERSDRAWDCGNSVAGKQTVGWVERSETHALSFSRDFVDLAAPDPHFRAFPQQGLIHSLGLPNELMVPPL